MHSTWTCPNRQVGNSSWCWTLQANYSCVLCGTHMSYPFFGHCTGYWLFTRFNSRFWESPTKPLMAPDPSFGTLPCSNFIHLWRKPFVSATMQMCRIDNCLFTCILILYWAGKWNHCGNAKWNKEVFIHWQKMASKGIQMSVPGETVLEFWCHDWEALSWIAISEGRGHPKQGLERWPQWLGRFIREYVVFEVY